MKKLSEKQKKEIGELVEGYINDIFIDCHGIAGTKSGDVTPEQMLQLDKITEDLTSLVIKQVTQNL